ncbi:MAG: FAD-binding oxidoreductase [Candidatus Latescibacteria bacterium]|nr:FAD-binding oxidoreductase [Candidatus Latescibacterota bacterium]
MIRDSYWLDQEYQPTSPLDGEFDVDIVISGAGITGLSEALFLAEAGVRVAVLERREVASGASGRNGGFMLSGTHEYYADAVEELTTAYGPGGRRHAREVWQLAIENHRLMVGLMQRYRIACDYCNHGSYVVAMARPDRGSHPRPMERVAQSARLLQEDGFDSELLDAKTMQGLLRSTAVSGALFNRFDGELHPVKYVRGLAQAARGRGVAIFENTPIQDVMRDGRGLLIRTPGGRVRAEWMVMGTNAYTPQLDMSYETRITPNRGQAFVTEPVAERLFNGVFYANDGWDYWRQLHDGPGDGGRLLFGGSRNHHLAAERGSHVLHQRGRIIKTYRGYKERPTGMVQRSNDLAFNRTFPHLAHLKRTHRWGGVMGFSFDSSPFVGETETPGVYVIAGFTGRGNAYATAAARILADRILERPSELESRFPSIRTVFAASRAPCVKTPARRTS